jgi:hypothetical protein
MLLMRTDHTISASGLYDDGDDVRAALESDKFLIVALTEVDGTPSLNVAIDQCWHESSKISQRGGGETKAGTSSRSSRSTTSRGRGGESTGLSFSGSVGVNGHVLIMNGRMGHRHMVGRCTFEVCVGRRTTKSMGRKEKKAELVYEEERVGDDDEEESTFLKALRGGERNAARRSTAFKNEDKRQVNDDTLRVVSTSDLQFPVATPPTPSKKKIVKSGSELLFSPATRRRKEEIGSLF